MLLLLWLIIKKDLLSLVNFHLILVNEEFGNHYELVEEIPMKHDLIKILKIAKSFLDVKSESIQDFFTRSIFLNFIFFRNETRRKFRKYGCR